MRLVWAVVLAAAIVAGVYHFGAEFAPLDRGYWRPAGDVGHWLGLAAAGLLISRSGGGSAWMAGAALVGALALAAFLTAQGLELPQERASRLIVLAAIGVLAAQSGSPGAPYILLAAVIAGLVHGHQLADDLAAARDLRFVGGLALGAATLALIGVAAGDAADRVAGARTRLAAGVAGVGVFLSLDHFGVI